jgi:S-disulfanyl-L-cysteine oxidoreductase SoxD
VPKKLARSAAWLGALGTGVAAFWALSAQEGQRTVRDGVFSAAQAARGERLFEAICTNCHEITEFTAAGAYLDEVEGEPLWDTFEYVWAEMPEDEPASLDPEDYAAVLAYIFSIYGLPSGEVAMPIDRESLSGIRIARPNLPGS